ncbi:MFS transporter [Candidatus Viridilinea mediisalina]|uniref:MFS transporter n=1 Tax=Candidatus Viridilinea mediisalina TaxID=2024553 RepID=UPI0013FDD6CA|nr:MFS transporter [Candidatus Viridilinea mediisalina]
MSLIPSITTAARRYLVYTALLTGGLAISALFFNLLLLALGYDQQSLHLPFLGAWSILGLMHSLPAFAAALSSLPLWWLVSRYGPRFGLVGGALLAAASLLGMALWPTPVSMLAWACLGGPAAVLFQVSAAPFMMRHSGPHERAMLFSLSAGLMIGVAGLGSLVGGFLPALLGAWLDVPTQSAMVYRSTFGVAACFVLLAPIPLLRLPPDGAVLPETPTRQLHVGNELRKLWDFGRAALPFVVSPLLISCGAALLIPFLNLYLRQRFGAPDAALGFIFAMIGIATGAATLLAPWLARRFGAMGSVVLTQALAIPCLLLLAVAPNLWLAAGIALTRAALMNMAAPLYEAYAMEHTAEAARPIVIGLINGAFSAGYIIGPALSAQVQRDYGFGPLFIATACLYAAGAWANYLIFLRPRRHCRL